MNTVALETVGPAVLRCLAAAILGLVALTPAPALSQDIDCAALEAQRAVMVRGAQAVGPWDSAVRRQRAEIDRARTYADSSGCGDTFFEEPVSPECASISERIGRMQRDLQQLEQQAGASRAGDDERRRALDEEISAYCPGLEQGMPADEWRPVPVDPDAPDAAPDDAAGPPGRGPVSKALCVRRCDGGFFPITYRATPGQIEGLGRLCQALCPNTEATLYTTSLSGDLSTAVASDGTPYTALPTAFKFEKSYDATCSCKPPHQSWSEALADAERMIESDKADVTVTPKLSDSMARPAVVPPMPSAAVKRARSAVATAKGVRRPRALPETSTPREMQGVAADPNF